MSRIFNQVYVPKPKRNVFNLSHERKFTMNFGDLVPILCEQTIPGDHWSINTEIFLRTMPLVNPMYHRCNVFTHFFFVPNRLVWNDWEDFITGGEDGADTSELPYFLATESGKANYSKGTLMDFLGAQVGEWTVGQSQKINALPFRAYQLIYNDWYRDQNHETELTIDKTDGQDAYVATIRQLRTRAWEKDYFTSALLTPLRGDDVLLPLTGSAPVYASDSVYDGTETNNQILYDTAGDPVDATGSAAGNLEVMLSSSGALGHYESPTHQAVWLDPNGTMVADMSSVSSATIEELRLALKTQHWLERNNVAGARYPEQILAHFGVRVPDYRLQRPEFLGGGVQPLQVSSVQQTSETGTTPQGTLAGLGISMGNTHRVKVFTPEHGYLIGIMSVLPKSSYSQGIRRHLLYNDKFDYYFPEFAQLGEQAIYEAEIYSEMTDSTSRDTWAYTSRYAEYKYIPSTCHGDMVPDGGADPLEYWTMTRAFDSKPALNNTFVKYESEVERVFPSALTGDKLIVNLYHNIRAVRPIPIFNNPNIL